MCRARLVARPRHLPIWVPKPEFGVGNREFGLGEIGNGGCECELGIQNIGYMINDCMRLYVCAFLSRSHTDSNMLYYNLYMYVGLCMLYVHLVMVNTLCVFTHILYNYTPHFYRQMPGLLVFRTPYGPRTGKVW